MCILAPDALLISNLWELSRSSSAIVPRQTSYEKATSMYDIFSPTASHKAWLLDDRARIQILESSYKQQLYQCFSMYKVLKIVLPLESIL